MKNQDVTVRFGNSAEYYRKEVILSTSGFIWPKIG